MTLKEVTCDLPTPEDAVESALASCWADHEDEPLKGAVIIAVRQDGSYYFTYSYNLNSAQIISMASFVQTVEALSFLGDDDD
jgi:hypothetical protein